MSYEVYKASPAASEWRFFLLTDKSGSCEVKIVKGDILEYYPEFKEYEKQAAADTQEDSETNSAQGKAASPADDTPADITAQLLELIESGAPFDIAQVKAAIAKVEKARKAAKTVNNGKKEKK